MVPATPSVHRLAPWDGHRQLRYCQPVGSASRVRAGWLIRRYLGATITLSVFAGLAGGAAVGLWGIARRTSTAYERFTAYEDAAPITVFACEDGVQPSPDAYITCTTFDYQDVLQFLHGLPAVRSAGRFTVVITGVARADRPDAWTRQIFLVPIDAEAVASLGRPIVVSGRLADPNNATEAVVNEAEQRLLHLQLGDKLNVTPYRYDEFDGPRFGVCAQRPRY